MECRQRLAQATWTPSERLSLLQEQWDLARSARGTAPRSDLESLRMHQQVRDEVRARCKA